MTALVGLIGGESCASKQIDPPGSGIKSPLQRTWDAQDRTPPGLDAVVERFEVSDETVPAAVVRLANEQGVLCGLYVVPWPEAPWPEPLLAEEEPFAAVSATFEDATVAQILNGLVAFDPRFAWWEDRGVITVALASTVEDPTHPLNVPLPLFEADEVPYLRALFAGREWRERLMPGPLFEEVYLVTGLLVGFAGSGPPADLYPPVTISAKGWTTVEILNEAARQLKLPWYIVDCRMLGGREIRFRMGVDLPPLPKGTPIAAAPPKAGTQRAAEEGPSAATLAPGLAGFLINAELPEPVVAPHESARLEFTVRNVTGEALLIAESYPEHDYQLTVINERGEPIPPRPTAPSGVWRRVLLLVQAGEEVASEYDLNRVYDLPAGGRYAITARRYFFSLDGGGIGWFESNTVILTVSNTALSSREPSRTPGGGTSQPAKIARATPKARVPMLPIRPIFERSGFRVSWDKAQQKATATIAELTATVEADSNVLVIGSQRVEMGRPAKLVKGQLLLPGYAISLIRSLSGAERPIKTAS